MKDTHSEDVLGFLNKKGKEQIFEKFGWVERNKALIDISTGDHIKCYWCGSPLRSGHISAIFRGGSPSGACGKPECLAATICKTERDKGKMRD